MFSSSPQGEKSNLNLPIEGRFCTLWTARRWQDRVEGCTFLCSREGESLTFSSQNMSWAWGGAWCGWLALAVSTRCSKIIYHFVSYEYIQLCHINSKCKNFHHKRKSQAGFVTHTTHQFSPYSVLSCYESWQLFLQLLLWTLLHLDRILARCTFSGLSENASWPIKSLSLLHEDCCLNAHSWFFFKILYLFIWELEL